MPQFTFEAPDGQHHTIEGPEGASKEQAFQMLQQHLGQGQQAQAPAPADDYHAKLSGALDTAMKALAPSWEHNQPGYSPYKPAQQGNMPNDAVNPVGTDAQMSAAIPGAKVARMMANGPPGRLQPAPPQPPVNINQMPTQQAMQNRTGLGGQMPPSSPVGGAATSPQGAGNALQTQLLRAGLEHGANALGHAAGIPMVGTAARAAARFAPKMLGF